eukprot:CAMPEP_0172812544 /NCGR_PEP_ID=MMETSP1075-20121228/10108_1 /TAXON_ID=2916 /ORGANISM="Ceratium fusus, Strain PA161109" /LENGTH=202 /DNA_ID=CAMNT_0013652117 /DNA_START=48 /DNA_END=656 /DNA_ORIENTATION=+
MTLNLNVCSMVGPLCEVSVAATGTVDDLKSAIEAVAKIPKHEQKLMLRQGWDMAVLQSSKALEDCGVVENGTDITMVRSQPYNGKYEVNITWNGTIQLQIFGTHAKATFGNTGFESEIEWDTADVRKCTFSGRRMVTTEWARRKTGGEHKAEEGVMETFHLQFAGEGGAEGFEGTFQRQYEGPLNLKGVFVGDEMDEEHEES